MDGRWLLVVLIPVESLLVELDHHLDTCNTTLGVYGGGGGGSRPMRSGGEREKNKSDAMN